MSLATAYANNGTVQGSVTPWEGPSRTVRGCISGKDSGHVMGVHDEGSCIEFRNNPAVLVP